MSYIGPSMGPLLGGFINYYANWRWTYYVRICRLVSCFDEDCSLANIRIVIGHDYLGLFTAPHDHFLCA